jgi:hypothetical protein
MRRPPFLLLSFTVSTQAEMRVFDGSSLMARAPKIVHKYECCASTHEFHTSPHFSCALLNTKVWIIVFKDYFRITKDIRFNDLSIGCETPKVY